MKSGYDQFFKKARENAQTPGARPSGAKPRFSMSDRQKKNGSQQQSRPQSGGELAAQLRGRIKQAKKPRRAGIPWKLVGGSFLGLMIAVAGFLGQNKIEPLLKKVEISMIGAAQAEEAKPADAAKAKEAKDEKKKDGEEKKAEEAPRKEFTEEEVNHFQKLNERKRELDAREEELNRMEAELQTQKVELEKRMQSLDKTRRDISSVLEERVKADDKKVDTLVQMYSNMKPQQAAKIFEEMDEDLAVDIIGRMKKKNAAEIMNLIKPEKAKAFSEKFAGYKRS